LLEEGTAQLKKDKEVMLVRHAESMAALRAETQAALDSHRTETQAALEAKDEELRNLSGETQAKEKERQLILAKQAEEQRELRVAHVQQMAVRRLGKQQLSKGWQTWLDGWLEQQRHKRMLAGAAGRLMKPALSAALTHWRADWQATQTLTLTLILTLTLTLTLTLILTPTLTPTNPQP
jgi:acyl transferase domain-containing protein